DELRAQADLLDEAAASMGQVGGRMETVADDLGAINEGLSEARSVLGGYAATASGARDLVEQAERDLGRQSRLAQVMVIALGLTIALGQIVPLYVGWELIQRPEVLESPAEDA
ncbi:MAG TPA: hypothetical protein VML96_02140, partial [Egibacteraceae bacterium]|nr:hypothetical protein [Egibacteraceae bacterium]